MLWSDRSCSIIMNILMAVGSATPELNASKMSLCGTTATRSPLEAWRLANESAASDNPGTVTMT